MQKQVSYGILFSCLGIGLGFAVGFPIISQLPFEKRGYIGVPLMLFLCIGLGVIGAITGVKIAGKKISDQD